TLHHVDRRRHVEAPSGPLAEAHDAGVVAWARAIGGGPEAPTTAGAPAGRVALGRSTTVWPGASMADAEAPAVTSSAPQRGQAVPASTADAEAPAITGGRERTRLVASASVAARRLGWRCRGPLSRAGRSIAGHDAPELVGTAPRARRRDRRPARYSDGVGAPRSMLRSGRRRSRSRCASWTRRRSSAASRAYSSLKRWAWTRASPRSCCASRSLPGSPESPTRSITW